MNRIIIMVAALIAFSAAEAVSLKTECQNVAKQYHYRTISDSADFKTFNEFNAADSSTLGMLVGLNLTPVHIHSPSTSSTVWVMSQYNNGQGLYANSTQKIICMFNK